MAEFEPLFSDILKLEGGWRLTQIPEDRGAMTWAGISRRANPEWDGWGVIDEQLNSGVDSSNIAATLQLQKMTKEVYKSRYFNKMRLEEIQSDDIAETLFSCAVLSGTYTAAMLAQTAVGANTDGIVGPRTVASINATDNELFDLRFALLRIVRYMEICRQDRSQRKFLAGWINRSLGGAEEWV